MKYFKYLDENGNIIRLDIANFNVSNGIEITEEEYKQNVKPLIFDDDEVIL